MSKAFLTMIFTYLLMCSCSGNQTSENRINVDISDAKIYSLGQIASDIEIIPLNIGNNSPIGSMAHLKSYDQYNFIYDDATQVIHLLDKNLKHINTLDRVGRGPQEYTSFSTYAYNEETKILTLMDRGTINLVHYRVPDFSFVSRNSIDYYLMAMEYIDNNKLFVVKEGDGGGGSMDILELSVDSISYQSSQAISYMAAEISPDQTITRFSSSDITYLEPNYINTIHKLTTKGLVAGLEIDFGSANIPQKYWEIGNENFDLPDVMSDMRYAIMPQYFIRDSSSNVSFWFMSNILNQHIPTMTLFYQTEDGKGLVCSAIRLADTNVILKPCGIIDNAYLSIVDAELLAGIESKNEVTQKAIEVAKQSPNNQIIIKYNITGK